MRSRSNGKNVTAMSEMRRKKAVMNWSGGKDSAHALWRILCSGEYEVVALLTTVNRDSERSTMHAIPCEILQRQAESIGIPLHIVGLASGGSMDDYSREMERAALHFRELGVTHFIFGDIYLSDVIAYRRAQCAGVGLEVVEPLWGKSSKEVMDDFLKSGIRCRVVTTMADGLGMAAIGRLVDASFVASLPEGADPNGENGEYHTLCYDGPLYRHPVAYRLGEPYLRSYDIKTDDGAVTRYSYCFADIGW